MSHKAASPENQMVRLGTIVPNLNPWFEAKVFPVEFFDETTIGNRVIRTKLIIFTNDL